MSDIRTVVAGAGGRMGQTLIRAIADTQGFVLAGAFEAKGKSGLGKDIGGGVIVTDDPLPLLAKADALLDFTTPAASVELAALSAQARIVHVIGTTGLS